MYITISTDGTVSLEDADVFAAFEVCQSGLDRESVLAALGDRGAVADESGHVFVAKNAVVGLADRAGDAGWEAGFAAMVGYAESKGWMDTTGEMIKAHIVASPEATTPRH